MILPASQGLVGLLLVVTVSDVLLTQAATIRFANIGPESGGWPCGRDAAMAIKRRFEEINDDTNGCQIVGCHKLELTESLDDVCDALTAMSNFYELGKKHSAYEANGEPGFAAVFGSGCSRACMSMAQIASKKVLDIPTWSWACSSPLLSDRTLYPDWGRFSENDLMLPYGIIAVIQKFGWKEVALIVQNDPVFSTTAKKFVELAAEAGVAIAFSTTIANDGDPVKSLEELKKTSPGSRILVTLMYDPNQRAFHAAMDATGMDDGSYVVFAIGWNPFEWASESKSTQGVIGVAAGIIKDTTDFFAAQDAYDTPDCPGSIYTVNGYDVATATMHAVNAILSMDGKTIDDIYDTDLFRSAMNAVDFEGMSGPVKLDENAERQFPLALWYMTSEFTKDRFAYLEIYNPPTLVVEKDMIFANGTTDPPTDTVQKTILVKWLTMDPGYGSAAWVLFIFTLVIGLGCIGASFMWNGKKIIKMTQYKMNAIITMGICLFCFATVFYSVDEGNSKSSEELDAACQNRSFFAVLGFGLFFGTLNGRLFRIKTIFAKDMKSVTITDATLLKKFVVPIFAVELIIVVTWMLVGAPTRQIHVGPEIAAAGIETYTVEQYGYCAISDDKTVVDYVGVIALIVQACLVVVTAQWAFECRNVTIAAINDSTRISYLVILVSVVAAFEIALSFAINDSAVLFWMITGGVYFMAWVAFGLMYALPFYHILMGTEESVTSMTSRRSLASASASNKSLKSSTTTNVAYVEKLEASNKALKARVEELEKLLP